MIRNNNKKDTQQRGQGALSEKGGERKSLTTSRLEKAGVVVHAQQSGVGKLVKVAVRGKLHKRGGKTHFPCEL
jgi:hypothetical protein